MILGNLALAQACLHSAVLGAVLGYPLVGASVGLVAIATHLVLSADRSTELWVVLAAGVFGAVVEVVEQQLGLFTFTEGGLLPVWVVVVWIGLGSKMRYTFHGLAKRPWLAALGGAVGGPLSFYTASLAGIVEVASPAAYGGLAVATAISVLGLIGIRWLFDRELVPGEYRLGRIPA